VVSQGAVEQFGKATYICLEMKCPVHGKRTTHAAKEVRNPGEFTEQQKEQSDETWKRKARNAVKLVVFQQTRNAMSKAMPIEALRIAVKRACDRSGLVTDEREFLYEAWGIKASKSEMLHDQFDKLIAKADQPTLLHLLLDLVLCAECGSKFGEGETTMEVAAFYGVDVKKIKGEVEKDFRAQKKKADDRPRGSPNQRARESGRAGKAESSEAEAGKESGPRQKRQRCRRGDKIKPK
jgi:uncharacterized Zn finger protein (UPF0148 family)